ncbi:alternate-type signal peptide domain-containing protein [Lysinibacter cavernae]|uniref:Alternate signal-mediated exported protein n=1 Tax=Lysinibacter cavernae TaxID=1640652 RepID=A0A7X5R085_9MICO|nr:alternate-type signal peptide domain-containing protein [Lysinibacter cavernae]NIH53279.1 alternate signal-mediated exported protein [Lysinibacter cavernae]
MNKLSKGLIVSGLGVALLLGTGGSLALWNVSAQSEAGSINTGDLNLVVAPTGQTWEIQTGPATWAPIADIADFKMVPGDVVRLTQPMNVTLVGDNMKASLTVDTEAAVVSGDATAADLFTVNTSFLAPDVAGVQLPVQTPGTNVWNFSEQVLGGTQTFKQQITFDFSAAASDRVGSVSKVDLSKTNFVLEQVAL